MGALRTTVPSDFKLKKDLYSSFLDILISKIFLTAWFALNAQEKCNPVGQKLKKVRICCGFCPPPHEVATGVGMAQTWGSYLLAIEHKKVNTWPLQGGPPLCVSRDWPTKSTLQEYVCQVSLKSIQWNRFRTSDTEACQSDTWHFIISNLNFIDISALILYLILKLVSK